MRQRSVIMLTNQSFNKIDEPLNNLKALTRALVVGTLWRDVHFFLKLVRRVSYTRKTNRKYIHIYNSISIILFIPNIRNARVLALSIEYMRGVYIYIYCVYNPKYHPHDTVWTDDDARVITTNLNKIRAQPSLSKGIECTNPRAQYFCRYLG